jgi:hypothetical protein
MKVTKTLINELNFDNILELMNSKDEKSKVLGLTILENSDINKSYIYMLLLYNNWIEIPKITNNEDFLSTKLNFINNMKSFDDKFDENNVSYKFIYSYIKDNEKELLKNLSIQEIKKFKKFIIKKFNDELIILLKNFNYNFFDDFDLIITEKI